MPYSLTQFDTVYLERGLPRWLSGIESACRCRDVGLTPGSGKSPGRGKGNPLQYSCLGNPNNNNLEIASDPTGKGFSPTRLPPLQIRIARSRSPGYARLLTSLQTGSYDFLSLGFSYLQEQLTELSGSITHIYQFTT